jgi:SRSO17 transposase
MASFTSVGNSMNFRSNHSLKSMRLFMGLKSRIAVWWQKFTENPFKTKDGYSPTWTPPTSIWFMIKYFLFWRKK